MIDWLKSLRPQPHWKPSEEHFQGLRRAITKADEGSDAERDLKDLYEQLKKTINMIKKVYSYVLKSASGDYYHTITTKNYKDVYDYMKNEANDEYEAWKSEWEPAWGEFDETHIDYAYYDKQSLSFCYQFQWKPNKEQMGALKEAYESYDFCDGERDALKSLYNYLKKL